MAVGIIFLEKVKMKIFLYASILKNKTKSSNTMKPYLYLLFHQWDIAMERLKLNHLLLRFVETIFWRNYWSTFCSMHGSVIECHFPVGQLRWRHIVLHFNDWPLPFVFLFVNGPWECIILYMLTLKCYVTMRKIWHISEVALLKYFTHNCAVLLKNSIQKLKNVINISSDSYIFSTTLNQWIYKWIFFY